MKKLMFFLLLAFVSLAINAQTRTIQPNKVLSADPLRSNSVTWSYIGVAADSMTANQDTLLYNITLNKAVPMNYYIKVGLDSIAGVDTTCTININGRMFDDESWTLIETVTTAAISAEINTVIESITDADYTLVTASHTLSHPSHTLASTIFTSTLNADSTTTFPVITFTEGAQTITEAAATATPTVSIKPSWRQIQVEIIRQGDDSVGEGIELKDIEWYFQEAN